MRNLFSIFNHKNISELSLIKVWWIKLHLFMYYFQNIWKPTMQSSITAYYSAFILGRPSYIHFWAVNLYVPYRALSRYFIMILKMSDSMFTEHDCMYIHTYNISQKLDLLFDSMSSIICICLITCWVKVNKWGKWNE